MKRPVFGTGEAVVQNVVPKFSATPSEGTLLTSWTNRNTEREFEGRKVCRGKQDSIVQGPCTT